MLGELNFDAKKTSPKDAYFLDLIYGVDKKRKF